MLQGNAYQNNEMEVELLPKKVYQEPDKILSSDGVL
jgi:hypothetical protein